jgi:predicted RNA-binding Zn-ribbon protein involved in translation (DUF1610 family)
MIDHIPNQYRFSHEYALFLHDILAQIVKDGEEAGLFLASFKLENEKHAEELERLSNHDKWDWLEANGYTAPVSDVIYRQVLAALLADFCHFVFEALSCSRKGKLTVAYALLRKPFKDNLFYFEWLLADPVGFVRTFKQGDPDELEEFRKEKGKRFPIIAESVKRTSQPNIFDAEFIDAIRYDRSVPYGFAGSWDHANHLITNYTAIRTAPQNFNLVFAGLPDDYEARWEFVYTRLPYLLYYAVEVVEAVVARLIPDPEQMQDNTQMRRWFGFMLWAESIDFDHGITIDETPMELPECPQCGTVVMLDRANMKRFYEEAVFGCQQCGMDIGIREGDAFPPT